MPCRTRRHEPGGLSIRQAIARFVLAASGRLWRFRDTHAGPRLVSLRAALTCSSVAGNRRLPHTAARCTDRLARDGDARLCSGELCLCASFCSPAPTHIEDPLTHFNQNVDEPLKAIADDSYRGRPCPFDAVP